MEIVVPRETDQEQAALLEQLERQQQQQQASGPPPLQGEDTPTRVPGEGGDPPTMTAEVPVAPPAPVPQGRSQRARNLPGYLADYHVGHMEMSPQRSGTPSTGKNSKPQLQNSPGSTGLLQKQQPPDQHSHLDNRYPSPSGNVGRSRWRYPIPMTDLEPPQKKEDEATTLLPAQLIRDGATVATTQPLRVALAMSLEYQAAR